MEATAILDRLYALGVHIEAHGDTLELVPGSVIPPDLVTLVRQHKPALMAVLTPKPPRLDPEAFIQESTFAGKPYRLRHPESEKAHDAEITEVEATLKRDGYALLWSNELQDLVAFYTEDAARQRIPLGLVAYSLDELELLFFGFEGRVSKHRLRLVHEAKKTMGGKVILRDPDSPHYLAEG